MRVGSQPRDAATRSGVAKLSTGGSDADLTIKERALARTTPAGTKPGRYRAPDSLLAFLEDL